MSECFGKLQKWNPRGFTFVTRDDSQPSVFCHAKAIEAAGMQADTGVLNVRIGFDIATRSDGR
jgi:cold shock CspA family protein